MSAWGTVISKLKEIIKSMIGSRTIEKTLHVTPAISSQMENAITLWTDMYKDQAPWIHEPHENDPTRVVSLGLPALISSEKARIALIEFQSEITTPVKEVEVDNPNYSDPEPDEYGNLIPSLEPKTIIEERPVGGTERAEYLESQYKKLKKQLRREIEYGIAKGGLIIKPYVVMNTPENVDTETESDITPTTDIEFDYIQADAFYPLSFNASGRITEAAFIQTKSEKDVIYRRLEYHKWENNVVTVINKAFKSENNTNDGDMTGIDLGQEIPLSSVPEWKDISERATIKNVTQPLFAYFKMPEANTIDTSSPLGVSGFSRAINLIKDADMQYSRLLWEYEGGELAIDIDRDALNDVDGHTVLNHLQNRLYRKVDLGEMNTYQQYAPALRDASYTTGLNTILMRIEDICGISRGTLSDSADIARTATELKILKQRSYQTNADIQASIEDTLRDVIYIMNTYCTLYEITPEGDYEVNFEWDDSIIVDVNEEINKRLTLQQNGLASKLENRMWYFGETEVQAREALLKIDEENQKAMENDMMMQSSQFGNSDNGGRTE